MSSLITPFCSESTAVWGADERRDRARRDLGVPELHREHHYVDGPDRGGIVRGLHHGQVDRPGASLSIQTVLSDRGEMCTARDERHIDASCQQPAPEEAADTARAHHRHTHAQPLPPHAGPCRR